MQSESGTGRRPIRFFGTNGIVTELKITRERNPDYRLVVAELGKGPRPTMPELTRLLWPK